MINFVFGIYRFVFSLLVLVGLLIFLIMAIAMFASSSGELGSGYSTPMVVVMLVGGFAFVMVLLGDFATKIKIADELMELKELLKGRADVSTEKLESQISQLNKQLTPPVKVMAVKTKVKEDSPPS